jgi:hypothetical protein
MKLYPLNAKSLKKSLKDYGVKVYRCKQGQGSVKNGVQVVVAESDLNKVAEFFLNIGVVDCRGNVPTGGQTVLGQTELSYLYMSEEMYNELNG